MAGRPIATTHDTMVHYDTGWSLAQLPPPICPKCGSHRTQVVGRSQDGRAVIVRCGACGERSRIDVSGSERPPVDTPAKFGSIAATCEAECD